ncbi:hypothetical protein [Metallibacterium scheffleri]
MLRIFLASIVFVATWWRYAHVVSPPVAGGIAAAVALAELLGSLAVGRNSGGAGSGLRALLWLGAPVLAWPVAAIAIEALVPALSQPEAASGAAILASLAGLAAAGHGTGMDSRRNVAALLAAIIPLYALGASITVTPYDPAAIGLACAAVATAAGVARMVLVLPQDHEKMLTLVASACASAALIGALPALAAFI